MSRKKEQKQQDSGPAGDSQQPLPETPVPEADPQPADELAALRAERDDLLARLQRVSADYVNYQKRVRKDTDQARTFANEELIKALLGVLDDMERAFEAARANHAGDDPLLTGMQLVHDNLLQTLGRFGLTPIESEGRPFDPDRHSAVMQQPTADQPPQIVLKELQRGYQLKGRTIRPAAVVVSAKPDNAEVRDTDPRQQEDNA